MVKVLAVGKLQRGLFCGLRYVYGMVVYTGEQTRIQMNAAAPPVKIGSFDRFLNIQITLLVLAQVSFVHIYETINAAESHALYCLQVSHHSMCVGWLP